MNNANNNINTELLKYPFDQYQRYRDIRDIINIIDIADSSPNILDIGGSPTAAAFLAGYNIITANIEPKDGSSLVGDGIRLPFDDNSFDVVITVDTLEHISENKREAFIDELLRVTGSYAIITCPFANGYSETAEQILNQFFIEVLNLKHRFLLEHLENGLPLLNSCLQWIAKSSSDYITIPSGYIHHWLPLMIIKYYIYRLSNGLDISVEVDRFYNYTRYLDDHKMPSYRQVVVVSKTGNGDILSQIEDSFKLEQETTTPDLNGVMAMWQTLRGVQILEERDREINRLKNLVTGYESGRVMRLMAVVNQLIGLIKNIR